MTNEFSTSGRRADRELDSALERVLGRDHRRTVLELVSTETGTRASSRQVLSWMRVNMPIAASQVDEVLN